MNGSIPRHAGRGRLGIRGGREDRGWKHAGIRVANLDERGATLPADENERLLVPLSGSFRVAHDDTVTVLEGRASVFDGPTDVLYLRAGSRAFVRGPGRLAVAEAPAVPRFPSRRIARDEVPVELRGAGGHPAGP